MNKKTLLEHLRRNELAAFFKTASQMSQAGDAWQNELVLLERRFVELEDLSSDGVLSSEEASRQRNGISRDAMKLVEELDMPMKPLHPAYPNVRKVKTSTLLLFAGLGLLAALLVWQFATPRNQQEKTHQEGNLPLPSSENSVELNPQTEQQTNTETTSPKTERTSKGTPLKVSGNSTQFESEIAGFLANVLQEKGIATHPAANGSDYASAIDCRFSVDKSRMRGGDRDDASALVITLTLTARDSDNTICWTKRFVSEKQALFPEDQEVVVVRRGLSSLRETIKSSGVSACKN